MNSRMWIHGIATLILILPVGLAIAGDAVVGTGDQLQPNRAASNQLTQTQPNILNQAKQLVFEQQKIGKAFELISNSFPSDQQQTQHATNILETIAGILESAQNADEKALAQETLRYASRLIQNSLNDHQLAGHGQVEIAYPFMQMISRVAHSAIQFDDEVAAKMFIQVGRIARNLENNPTFPAPALRGIAGNIVAEAKGYALQGKIPQATESLRLAYEWGFVDFDIALNDEVLCSIDDSGTLKQMTNQAQASYKATVRTQVQNALMNFGRYPIQFKLDGLEDGKVITQDDYKGKILILDLGATWCAPCVKSIPHLKHLQAKFKDRGVRVLNASFENGESLEANRKLLHGFIEEHEINYDLALGNDALKASVRNFQQFPSLVFVDRQGTVRYMASGYHDATQITTVLEMILESETRFN